MCRRAAAVALLALSSRVVADDVWLGGADASWDNPANWSLGRKPAAGDNVAFATPPPATGPFILLGSGEVAQDLTFNDSYTLNGGDLAVAGRLVTARGGTGTINSTLTGSSGLTVAGNIALGGVNTFSGTVTIGGTLRIASDAALGDPANNLNLQGGTLQIDGTFTSARNNPVVIKSGGGRIDVTAGHTFTYAGNFQSGYAVTKSGAGTMEITGGLSIAQEAFNITGGILRYAGNGGGGVFIPGIEVFNATLELNNNLGGNSTTRLGSQFGASDLLIGSGNFNLIGMDGGVSGEYVGRLRLEGGVTRISITPGAGGTAFLDFRPNPEAPRSAQGLERSSGTLNVSAPALGGATPVYFSNVTTGQLPGWFTVNDTDFAKYDANAGLLPLSGGDYVGSFASGANVRLSSFAAAPAAISVNTLNLDASAGPVNVTVPTSGSVSIANGGLLKSGAFTASIAGGPITSGISELYVHTTGADLSISSPITGSLDLVKSGAGTLVLSGSAPNTYSGVTRVGEGVLQLSKDPGAFAVPGDVIVEGGTLLLTSPGQIPTTANITVFSGVVQHAFNTTVSTASIKGGTTLVQAGTTFTAGTLSNSAGNLQASGTVVAGKFTFGVEPNAPATAPARAGSGTRTDIDVASGTNVAPPGGLLKTGTGGLTFIGITTPTVTLASDATQPGRLLLGGNVDFTIIDPATGAAHPASAAVIESGGSAPLRGVVDLGGAARTFTVTRVQDTLRISARISKGGLQKSGQGLLQLSGDNDYSGGTGLFGGTLEVDNPAALGTGDVYFAGGTLSLRGRAVGAVLNNRFTSDGTSGIRLDVPVRSGGDAVQLTRLSVGALLKVGGAGGLHVVGQVTLLNDAVIDKDPDVTFSTVTGDHSLTKTSGGTLTLGGSASNTYGATVITGGTLALAKGGGSIAVPHNLTVDGPAIVRLLAPQQLAPSATLLLNSAVGPAVVDLNGKAQTIAALKSADADPLSLSGTIHFGLGGSLTIAYGAGADPLSMVAAQLSFSYHGGAWDRGHMDISDGYVKSGFGLGYHDSGQALHVGYARYGDTNLDGAVDFTDLLSLAQHYGVATGATWDSGDFNYDGKVTFDDLLLLAQVYGRRSGLADSEARNVPEPALIGLVALAAVPRWRNRRHAVR